LGAPHTRHRTEAFLSQQYFVSDTRIYRVHCQDSIASRRVVQMQRLNQKDFPAFMAGMLMRRHNLADDTSDEH